MQKGRFGKVFDNLAEKVTEIIAEKSRVICDRWATFEEKVRKSPSYGEMSDEIEEFLRDSATQFGMYECGCDHDCKHDQVMTQVMI